MQELTTLSIASLRRLLVQREVSASELTEAYLSKLEKHDPALHSFVVVTAELAVDAAKHAAEKSGALTGIPFGIKDVIDLKGVPTTGQSRSRANHIAEHNSTVVERLCEAGAVPLGKTATWEFAHGGPSWDILFPPARNPWDLNRSPSGSSSGSAAAVAARLTPFALGTDTGGSIRTPAAVCGVVGLKPTYGLVSRGGCIPNSFSQDHIGPITGTVEDAAIVLEAIAGYDVYDSGSVNRERVQYIGYLEQAVPRGLRVGVPWKWFTQDSPVSLAVLSAFEASMKVLASLGAELEEVELPPLHEFEAVKKIIALSDLYSLHGPVLRHSPELLGSNLRGRIVAGALLQADDLVQAQRLRGLLQRAMNKVFNQVEILALPMSEPASVLRAEPPESLFETLGFASPFNVTGHPAISIPNGKTKDGLPLSLQLVGRHFCEARLLNVAHQMELVFDSIVGHPAGYM
ncbi:amidase [Falsochrobactrum shanghaiense]|nr:amidase [Falsochrobactrum shanghaiense]